MPLPPRKYTVSPKVLAANRANLAKANLVPREVRYRSTPRRLAACRQNLLKAHEYRRSHGGDNMRRGVYCASLERSLRQAGEQLDDFKAHTDRFLRVFHPSPGYTRNAVLGMARAVWRRTRALRGEARWESRLLRRWLERMETAAARSSLLPASEAWAELFQVFNSRLTLEHDLGKLHRRIQIVSDLVLWLGYGIDRGGRLMLDWVSRPPEALGNPFYSPRQVMDTLRSKSLQVCPVDQWQAWTLHPAAPASLSTPSGSNSSVQPVADCSSEGRPQNAEGTDDGTAAGLMPPPAFYASDFTSLAARLEAVLSSLTGNTDAGTLRNLTQILGQRLNLFNQQAETESERLKELLENAAASELSRRQRRDLVREIAGKSHAGLETVTAAAALEHQLREAARAGLPESRQEELNIEIVEAGLIWAEELAAEKDGIDLSEWDLDHDDDDGDEDEEDDDDDLEDFLDSG